MRDVGVVALGPDMRRGAVDWSGAGEHVSGIIVMREGADALDVIRGVKTHIRQIESGLAAGVKVVPVYDRSVLSQARSAACVGSM